MRSCLESIPASCQRVFVAFSGGLDSSVLLHLLVSKTHTFELIPWHINHGLIENAAQMERFCVEQARGYGLEMRLDRLDLHALDSNIEAVARRQRYRLFEQETRAGDCILTAHHADDQAETLVLNALRGSGVAGLRGIASRRYLGKTLLLRPMLDISRAQLEAYANEHELAWYNDPSNQNLRFDRNYLRQLVLPAIKTRWPGYLNALSTCSEIQSETQELLSEIALQDLETIQDTAAQGGTRLDLPGLLALSLARRKNLIRYWVESAGLTALPQARLQTLMQQLQASPDAVPEIAMPDYSIRIYDQRLFLVTAARSAQGGGEFEFGLRQDIEIEQFDLKLSRQEVFQRLKIEDREQLLTLKFRRPGEPNTDAHRLKRLFQRHRVPPWERAGTAQVYLDGQLEGLLL